MKMFNSFGRMSLAVVALCAASNAWADNKLYIEDFAINPGDTLTIEVLLENGDPISSLQFDIDMPEGLKFLDNTIQRNPDRITRGSHSISYSVFDASNDIDRFVILENATDPSKSALKMNEGAIFTIDVCAAKTFKQGDIKINSIVGSNNTTAEAILVSIPDYTAHVDAYVGTYSFSVEEVTLDAAHGATATIDFNLNNDVDMNGIEMDLVVPAGIQLVEDAEGELFTYTDRLNINHTITSMKTDEGYRVIIAALTSDTFAGTEGALFSFTIKMDEDAAESLVIEAKNVKVSNVASASYNVYSESKVNVIKENLEGYIIRTHDVNNDQSFDIDDVQALFDIYLSTDEIVADINGDGEYDIDDVQALFDILLAE